MHGKQTGEKFPKRVVSVSHLQQCNAPSFVSLTLPNFTTMTQQLKEYWQELCDTLTERFNEEYPNSTTKKTFSVKKGRKYYKIVEDGSSAHAFIDIQTGDVFKPASWNKPAEGVRYNVLNDESRRVLFNTCDWAGGYLYYHH